MSNTRIKEDKLQLIKGILNIEEVIGEFITLKKKGNSFLAICPFHNEKTPSFSVLPSKNIYKCFGCDAKGDAIEFLQRLEGMSFVDAVIYLGNKYGIQIQEKELEYETPNYKKDKETLYIIHSLAKNFYITNLINTKEGKEQANIYLDSRNITESAIKKFEIGYGLNNWDAFYKFAKQKGYSNEILEKSGLVIKNAESTKHYDRFRARCMFPIHNLYGKIIAFGGRKLTNDENIPKYINSPESEIFVKSNILYGIYFSKKYIKEKNNCYLVEGYTDVISLYMKGVNNVVASGGTSLTENQIKLIKRFTDNITIIFDGDNAGLNASRKGINNILEQDLNVKILPLPPGNDPDNFIQKHDYSSFLTYENENIKDFVEFKAGFFTKKQLEDPVKRALAIREIMDSILVIPDSIKRNIFIKKCSNTLEIDEDILITEHNRILNNNVKSEYSTEKYNLISNINRINIKDSIDISEKELVKFLIKYHNKFIDDEITILDYILKETEEISFSNQFCSLIIDELRNLKAMSDELNVLDQLFNLDNIDLKNFIIDLISEKNNISPNWEEKFHHIIINEISNIKDTVYKLILKLKFNILRNLVLKNQHEIAEVEGEDNIIEKLQIDSFLKQQLKGIVKQLGIVKIDMPNLL